MRAIGTIRGDARAIPLRDATVHCCVTSPPYWGLRDYGHERQLGLEPTPDEYVANMVSVFREVRRVLRPDGTLWLNLGDSYAASSKGSGGVGRGTISSSPEHSASATAAQSFESRSFDLTAARLKPKDLVGIPWRVAFALQADGWYLRSEIIWHKPNPMPSSVTDRCTVAHEHLFMLSRSPRYYYDAKAIQEPSITQDNRRPYAPGQVDDRGSGHDRGGGEIRHGDFEHRNKRDVWTIPTTPYRGAHFAVMPEKLIEPCVLAGCPEEGTVLDPFAGSGTVGVVALRHRRGAILNEVHAPYHALIAERVRGVQIGLAL